MPTDTATATASSSDHASPRRRAGLLRGPLAVAAVAALLLAPLPALAQDANLAPGATATVTGTGGDGVLLREGPGYDALVLEGYPDGTVVSVTDGPIYAEDGSVWFEVRADGRIGYMVGDYLRAGGTVTVIDQSDGIASTPGQSGAGNAGNATTTAAPGPITISESDGVTTIDASGPDVTDAAPGTTRTEVAPTITTDVSATEPVRDDASGSDGQRAAQLASDIIEDPAAAPAGTAGTVTDLVNLRAAPDPEAEVLRVLPAGSEIVVTGEAAYGWTPAWYNGTDGFISSDLVADSGVATYEQRGDRAARSGTATTIEDAELKASPDPAAEALAWIPAGTSFTPEAGPDRGFYQATIDGQTGWVSGAFLDFGGDRRGSDAAPAADAEAATDGASGLAGFGGLAWPVEGGSWSILQGYNGTSHVNQDSTWQYKYSLDLVREDGDTAGHPVLAPATGTVRWTDPSSGGIAIDLGNGHAVALYHVTYDGLKDGAAITQGQQLGTVSGTGGMGFAGTPHLHFALWKTNDGGNWDRQAIPFTGEFAVEGTDLPDVGGSQQHTGVGIRP